MKPRLIRPDGEVIILGSSGLSVGRDARNQLRVDHPTVSGSHCLIEQDGDGFAVLDCNSTNGTRLNGILVEREVLQNGDVVYVGPMRLTYFDGEQSSEVELHDDLTPTAGETIELNADTISHFVHSASHHDSARLDRDLQVLLAFSNEIANLDDAHIVERELFKSIFAVTPAEAGAWIRATAGGDALLPEAAIRHGRVSESGKFRVSRTVSNQVLATGKAILLNNLIDKRDASASLKAYGVQSVVCVPLAVRGEPTGVVYVDTTRPEDAFDRRHLELVAAMVSIAAVAEAQLSYMESLEAQIMRLEQETYSQHGMIGESTPMMKVYEQVEALARARGHVLVLGESGTGKELVAHAVHNRSSRRSGPFIAVNCGLVTRELFESAFFGHVKGAFTSADRDHKGFLEAADKGTLFLDEIGDLAPECQAGLLRFLQNGEIRRVGAGQSRQVDVRVIAATNKNLGPAGSGFRQDLKFRFQLEVTLPPLRDRGPGDIAVLASFFLALHQGETDRVVEGIHPKALRSLQEYSWPGNVGELSVVIRRAVVFGRSRLLMPEDLSTLRFEESTRLAPGTQSLSEHLLGEEKRMILATLENTRGRVSEAAAMLKRAPTFLQRRITQLGLRPDLDRIRGEH